MNFIAFGIIGFMFLNGILLYGRQSKWVRSRYKWLVALVLFLTGGIVLLIHRSKTFDVNLFFAECMTPAVFSVLDYGLERLSFKLHNRKLYLWLRWSDDIDNKNLKFKTSDRIFSIFLLYTIIALLILPIVLLKKIYS